MKNDVVHLPIDQIQPNPLQPRGAITSDSLGELVDSIKTHGIIQPLLIAHTPAGYQIIAGERRWRAARIAGLSEVPVVITETTPQGMLEMAIVENVQRSDLNPIDRAKSFDRLMVEFNLSNVEISKRIGKSAAYISNTLRLLDLPDALKDGLISGVISEGHARALAGIPDTQLMIEAYKIILREGGSVRRAEELARRFKKEIEQGRTGKETATRQVLDELMDRMALDIQSSLGDKNTRVKIRRSAVETAVHIVLRGKPDETESQIQLIYQALANKKPEPINENYYQSNFTPPRSPSEPENSFEPYTDSLEPITAADLTPADSPKANEFEDY